MFKKTLEVLSFLAPLEVELNPIQFNELIEIDFSKLKTLLTRDFFDNLLVSFPLQKVLEHGDWVEIGVWKGGGALFLKALMVDLNINRQLHLYDTFGSIPISSLEHEKDKDFIANFNMPIEILENVNYKEQVINLFNDFKLNNLVEFIAKDVSHINKEEVPETISFLHLDVDFYEPTLAALELFYDKIISNGIIIVDDYYMELLNCKDAVDYFFKSKNIDLEVHGKRSSTFSLQIIKP